MEKKEWDKWDSLAAVKGEMCGRSGRSQGGSSTDCFLFTGVFHGPWTREHSRSTMGSLSSAGQGSAGVVAGGAVRAAVAQSDKNKLQGSSVWSQLPDGKV